MKTDDIVDLIELTAKTKWLIDEYENREAFSNIDKVLRILVDAAIREHNLLGIFDWKIDERESDIVFTAKMPDWMESTIRETEIVSAEGTSIGLLSESKLGDSLILHVKDKRYAGQILHMYGIKLTWMIKIKGVTSG